MEKMKIRRAMPADLEKIEAIYAAARQFMCENGNPTQWNDGYPRRELLETDIRLERLYVAVTEDQICGVFMFALGEDPTYSYMEDGKTHIGIRNVRRRLQSMVGGTLTISSTPGKGTRAVVCIPKE